MRLKKLEGLAARIERKIVPGGWLDDLKAEDVLDPKSLGIVDKYLTVLDVIRKESAEDKTTAMQPEDLLQRFRAFLESLRNTSDEVKDVEYGDPARINSRAEALELATS